MEQPRPSLSTASVRRPLVIDAALSRFARGGYYGTTIADVALEAAISPSYVSKLFTSKERLFVAALEECFAQILTALAAGADAAKSSSPDEVLYAMGDAYSQLIRDRRLLQLQVHAQSVSDIPEIGDALRAGMAQVTNFAQRRSGGDDKAVQRFIAFGQLCHLIVTARIDEISENWAHILSDGIRHPA